MLEYNSAAARRLRQARRLASGARRSIGLRRSPKPVKAFWWDGNPNFGDELTPWLLPHFGILPVLRPASAARFIGVGSILEMVPADSHAWVWGSGLMLDQPRKMPNARFLAVRGPITRDLLGLPTTTPLGDPGLLLSRFIPPPPPSGKIAVVVHGVHDLSKNVSHALLDRHPKEMVHVRTDQPVYDVVSQIASADLVVSSSLHGLIVADSYGIPAVWATPEDAVRDIPDMKFYDYHSTVGASARTQITLTDATSTTDLRRAAVRADPEQALNRASLLGKILEQARDELPH